MSPETDNEPKFGGERLPRHPRHYEPTRHFVERFKYRTDPTPKDSYIREILTDGIIKNTQDPLTVYFERDIYEHTWRIVARVNPGAFEDNGATHRLLTIYAVDAHGGDHREVFDEVEP